MTPATGVLTGSIGTPALAITSFTADPETVSPNDDGQADVTTLTYGLAAPATVSATVFDPIGTPVLELITPTRRVAGQHVLSFAPGVLPDGSYTIQLKARGDDGTEVSSEVSLLVTRTLGFGTVTPALFSPNGDGRADRLRVRFRLLAPATVKVRILRDQVWVATPFAGPLLAGARGVSWDGSKRLGRPVDGSYTAVVEATDELGMSSVTLPFTSDTRAPVLRFLPGPRLRVWVSEPATLVLRIAGRPSHITVAAAGPVVLPARPGTRVHVIAWDGAGNVSLPIRMP
jgi:hypothetical protein